jgi:hypothetical protein
MAQSAEKKKSGPFAGIPRFIRHIDKYIYLEKWFAPPCTNLKKSLAPPSIELEKSFAPHTHTKD